MTTYFTIGLEGGPLDGGAVSVEADEEGLPPYRQSLNGATYVRMPFGIDPHHPHWHYCHCRAQPPAD